VLCLTFLCVVGVPSTARAALRVRWDCFLPSGGVDCTVLESSLQSKIPFLTFVAFRDTHPEPDVTVSVSNVPAEDSTRYKLDFVGKTCDGYRSEVHTTDKIPYSIDSTTATVRIMTKLERGLAPFMDQKVAAEVRGGTLSLELADPVGLPFTGRPEQESVKWYVSPSIGGYLSSVEGVGINASGSASVSLNYSEKLWRLQSSVGFNYNRQSQPVPGTNETASIQFIGANTNNIISWSLGSQRLWSLGLLFGAEKNPQANYTFRANVSAGVEFDLIPLQTANQRNFGFRCAIGPEYQKYDATNIEGLNEQFVGREFCDLFFSWHFQPVDLGANVGETAIVENIAYRSFYVGLSATFRITDNITVGVWTTLQQVNKAINEGEPSNATYATAQQEIEASMEAAVQQGYTAPFGVQGGLSLRYLFGNGSLSVEDQRWKSTSNLR
jgi:hypothetical protein